jgi:predicted dehydrogenase
MRLLLKQENVEVAAFCDPDQNRLEEKGAEFEKLAGRRPRLEQDLRRVLDDRSIDVVTIATCNHWHALSAIWAMQAGKHVYVEKPLCHDAFEGQQMIAAARKYGRVAQGGTQRRSSRNVRRAVQALREGVIGDLYMARCIHYQRRDSLGFKYPEDPPKTLNWDLWLGPAPLQPFHGNLVHYNWHWFWDFGNGELGNNGVHYIDIARWGLNKGLPSRVYSTGGRYGYKDQGQTPNTQVAAFTFDDGTELVAEIRGRFTNSEQGVDGGVVFYGSKGYMISDPQIDGRFQVFLNGSKTAEPAASKADGDDNAQEAHFRNILDAVRTNDSSKLAAEINETYLSTMICLLGNI